MAQVPGRKLPLETYHQVTLTGDQLNTVHFAMAHLKDLLEGGYKEAEYDKELDLSDLDRELELVNQIILGLDGLR